MIINLKKDSKITVVGDIHEHSEQFFNLIDEIKPDQNNILVSVGDIFDRGFGSGASTEILKTLIKLNLNGSAYMVRGNHEQKRQNKNIDLSDEERYELRECYKAEDFIQKLKIRARRKLELEKTPY